MIALLLGCGDGLVDSDWRGDPLFTLSGQVLVVPATPPAQDTKVSVQWLGPDQDLGNNATEEVFTAFPAQYWMTLFHPPPDDAIRAQGTPHARGVIILYPDLNGNDQWDPQDEEPNGSSRAEVFYMVEDVGNFPAGFHIVNDGVGQRPDFDVWEPDDPGLVDLYIGEIPGQ